MVKRATMIINLQKRIFVLLLCCVFVCTAASASISSRIDSVVSRKNLKKVKIGIEIIEAKSGKIVYKRNPRNQLIPASNMKVITSAVALEVLGSDYQFKTALAMLGRTLVVIGGGDPLLCDSVNDSKYKRKRDWLFADIIKTLKARGVKSLDAIVVDSTFFDDMRVHPSWSRKDIDHHYACQVSGLNYHRNCISIKYKRSGKVAPYSMTPLTRYVQIVDKVRATSSGSNSVSVHRNGTSNKYTLKGKCRSETGFEIPVERPALFFGTVLSERLKLAGIKVAGGVKEKYVKNDPKIEILKVYKTPLTDVLARCNKDSFNMAAESLVKTISAEHTNGKINGEWKHGFELIGMYLKRLGIEKDQYVFDDGCGLSRKNRLTADTIARVLVRMYHSDNRKVYIDSLAIGGVEGTTYKYFKESKYKGKIFAKTGFITGVRSFSGYAKTDDGDYIFSILTEGGGPYVRAAINDIVKAIF
ncbi:MAG: D-alanyl-D-alanine carboxypeptidase/D-alanyl-D-alanine-endopeptidase [Planctomycetes bacterium]|nr:D-alanyl-D-alanine carboxypeptidase/D-alanyl-D-alanine-endopeptidase [Planctomycetota bacterium]